MDQPSAIPGSFICHRLANDVQLLCAMSSSKSSNLTSMVVCVFAQYDKSLVVSMLQWFAYGVGIDPSASLVLWVATREDKRVIGT